jgi:hypothetical protein
MVEKAQKKMLYQELHVQPLNEYLQQCTKTFDLVVAADVFSYVGDLAETFQQVPFEHTLSLSLYIYICIHHSFTLLFSRFLNLSFFTLSLSYSLILLFSHSLILSFSHSLFP